MASSDHSQRLRIGWWVFIGLAVVTGIEFGLSLTVDGTLPYLTVTALVKAALIVAYFMHLAQIWRREAESE